ncbi:hypothetical protein CGLO_13909 [Colletotrichum gloeosporioides Cg-14]|uniref:Uncharacterized protein n=1 Tax=Colletotrichum gloeosporioides (strain Cg-14) TaxID=1237896 RepID=T0LFF9_COLGC|nr:hypothetical protein CGLO_13909 [Colletotrichum gloeosporioides Cg-14]
MQIAEEENFIKEDVHAGRSIVE